MRKKTQSKFTGSIDLSQIAVSLASVERVPLYSDATFSVPLNSQLINSYIHTYGNHPHQFNNIYFPLSLFRSSLCSTSSVLILYNSHSFITHQVTSTRGATPRTETSRTWYLNCCILYTLPTNRFIDIHFPPYPSPFLSLYMTPSNHACSNIHFTSTRQHTLHLHVTLTHSDIIIIINFFFNYQQLLKKKNFI